MTFRFLCVAVLGLGVASAHAAQEDVEDAAPKPEVACEQRPYSFLITVKNVKSSKGLVTVDLHDDNPDTWLKKGARLGRVRVPAVEGETKICLPVEKPGTYAFALYHDRDGNKKLNKNWIGLPSEPYGVSNDAPIRLGPPSHKDAALQVTGPLTVAVVTLHD